MGDLKPGDLCVATTGDSISQRPGLILSDNPVVGRLEKGELCLVVSTSLAPVALLRVSEPRFEALVITSQGQLGWFLARYLQVLE